MRPLASTPSNICKERVFSQVATFLPFLLVFQGFLPLLAHSLRIPWAYGLLDTLALVANCKTERNFELLQLEFKLDF